MSDNEKKPQEETAPATEGSEQAAPAAAPPQNVDPFTVLFNAVEIANRRGAYSLRESGVISRALDIVRSSVQIQPATDQVSDTPATVEEKKEEPTIEASS